MIGLEKKNIIYWAIKYRKITIFSVILLTVFGVYNYDVIPKQEAPEINPPVAVIDVTYPGASPEDVERLITRKIEDEVAEIRGYDYSNSTSKNSVSVVVLWLDQDVDVNQAWTELREKMDSLEDELPDEASKININTDLDDTAGILFSISGDQFSNEQIIQYAEKAKKELEKINGLSRIEIVGEQKKEIKVKVDITKLNEFNLSLHDIVNIIQGQNIEIPSGEIDDGEFQVKVKTEGMYQSIDEIADTIIDVGKESGHAVRLKDIADVSYELEDASYKIKHNNKNAVLLVGYFKEDENIVPIGKEVQQRMERLEQELPENLNFDPVVFQPEDVKTAVNQFILNLLEGVVLVVFIVYLGMGIRNAIVVSMAIPLSILITFTMMNLLNIEVHQISIAALIIALGMLVDNAIVVSDAIQVRFNKGEERLAASIKGVQEVAIPVLSSTLTTIGAFLPLLLLSSIAGDYISSLPKIIMISLAASYLIALLVTPVMAYLFFKKTEDKVGLVKLRHLFDSLLQFGMKRKMTTLFIVFLVVISTLFLSQQLGLQFFPKADKQMFHIDIKTEKSMGIKKTESLTNTVSEILDGQEEIVGYTSAIGGGLPKFFRTVALSTPSQDFAQILVQVDLEKGGEFKTNSQFAEHLQNIFDRNISGGAATVKLLEEGEPIGAPIVIRVSGDHLDELHEAASEIRKQLSLIQGTTNIKDDFTDKIYEFYVDIHEDKANYYGLSKYDIQQEINIALMGKNASTMRQDGEEYDITIKSDITTKEDLENLRIKSSVSGQKLFLKEVADIDLIAENPIIHRYDRNKTITVYSDVRPGFSSVTIQEQLTKMLETKEMGDVEITFDGEKAKINENFGNMGVSGLIAVFVIYGILLIQFYSFVQPLIILFTIPLSGVGSILGLYLFQQPLSFTALFGMVSLFGIVVNNAIVLIDYINQERKKGNSIEQACIESVNKRFRPILLTTTTTVIGLVPLVFSGSDLFTPMSISLMSGLLISTLLTLVVIPVVYSLVESTVEKIFIRKKSTSTYLDI